MAIRFDQTTSWIMAALLAGSLFFAVYFVFRQVAKDRENDLVQAGKAHLTQSKDATGKFGDKEFVPDAPSIWGYLGSGRPANWASLDEGFALCGTGRRQSPISINDSFNDAHLKPILFKYQDSGATLRLNSGELAGEIDGGGTIEFDGDRFKLERIVLHLPAEHRRQGIPYPMEIQLQHKDVGGGRVNISVFVERGLAGPELAKLIDNLPEEDLNSRDIGDVSWAALLPSKKNYFTYIGSLTYPPCTENVRWVVMTNFIELDQARISKVAKLVSNNARPVQALNGREIRRSVR